VVVAVAVVAAASASFVMAVVVKVKKQVERQQVVRGRLFWHSLVVGEVSAVLGMTGLSRHNLSFASCWEVPAAMIWPAKAVWVGPR